MRNGSSHNESLESRMTRLEARFDSGMASMSAGIQNLDNRFASLDASLSAARQTNWGAIFGFIAAATAVVGGVYSALSSRSELWAIQSRIETMSYVQPIIMASEQSKVDRASLHSQATSNAERISAISASVDAKYAEFKSGVIEQETQFAGMSNSMNAKDMELERSIAILWEKEFGIKYPQSSFFPVLHRTVK